MRRHRRFYALCSRPALVHVRPSYDASGNVLTATDPYNKSTLYIHVGHSRLATVTLPTGRSIKNTYDAVGKKSLLSTTTDGSGRLLTYTARNEEASVSDSGTTSFQYDENGNKTRTFYPNSLFAALWYDDAGREYAHYNLKPLGGGTNQTLSSYGYKFDDDGRVLNFNEGTDGSLPPVDGSQTAKTTFVYDGQGRLTNETRTGTHAHTRTYRYNANGEQTSCAIGGVTTTFGYDYEGQLTSITSPSGTVGYGYNGDGRQGARTVGGVTFGYFNDGPTTLVEKNLSTNAVTDSYVWGSGGLGRHNGEVALYDGLGTERQVSDSGQNVTATNMVSAFGKHLALVTFSAWQRHFPPYFQLLFTER